jgi:hypothetical protein
MAPLFRQGLLGCIFLATKLMDELTQGAFRKSYEEKMKIAYGLQD